MKDRNWILYADDDADDRLLLEEAFSALGTDKKLFTVPDGKAALDYLDTHTPPLPCLVILDLNMPGIGGKEVAERVRSHPAYKSIPLVIFTTSANPADRRGFAQVGIEMITKPVDLNEFENTAARLASYCS